MAKTGSCRSRTTCGARAAPPSSTRLSCPMPSTIAYAVLRSSSTPRRGDRPVGPDHPLDVQGRPGSTPSRPSTGWAGCSLQCSCRDRDDPVRLPRRSVRGRAHPIHGESAARSTGDGSPSRDRGLGDGRPSRRSPATTAGMPSPRSSTPLPNSPRGRARANVAIARKVLSRLLRAAGRREIRVLQKPRRRDARTHRTAIRTEPSNRQKT